MIDDVYGPFLKVIVLSLIVLLCGTMIIASYGSSSRLESTDNTLQSETIKIYDVHDLQAIDDDLTADYEIMNDIDATDTEYWNDGRGFEPIGDGDVPFLGSLEGNGFDIDGLTIDRYDDPDDNDDNQDVGLFAEFGDHPDNPAFVSNLHLVNVSISGYSRVGGIVGSPSSGYINESSVSGYVEGRHRVGMIAGQVMGDSTNIINCHSAGQIDSTSSDNEYFGGIVGSANGLVENCYSTVEMLDGPCEETSGIVVGRSFADVYFCYGNSENSPDRPVVGYEHSFGSTMGNKLLTTDSMTYPYSSEAYDGWDENVWVFGDHEYVSDHNGVTGYPALSVVQVETHNPSDVGIDSATVHGEISSMNVDQVEAFFEYREVGESWSNVSQGVVTEPQMFQEGLSLSSSTEYEFRFYVVDQGGFRMDGTIVSFSTYAIAEMEIDEPTEVGPYEATIHGEVLSIHSSVESFDAYFEWKKASEDTWMETSKENITMPQTLDSELTSLDPETAYEYRLVAELGEEYDKTDIQPFYTGDLLNLTLTVEGNGSVDVEGYQYSDGDVYRIIPDYPVVLTAQPDRYCRFEEWTQYVESYEEEIVLEVQEDIELTAIFSGPWYELNLEIISSGSVNVEPYDENLTYLEGTEVVLTAEPEDGFYFRSYSGNVSSFEEEIVVEMDWHKSVTAEFSYQDDYGYIPSDDTSSSGLMEFVNSEILVLLVASVFVVIGIVQARRDGSL